MTRVEGSPDTRVILLSAGETSLDRVRKALHAAEGFGRSWLLDEVRDVSPMDAAFNEMLKRADLRYHVQVDADMELRPRSIERMREFIDQAPGDVWQVSFPLWDTLFRRPIQGVKIYRSDVARSLPYRPVHHCEMDQAARAAEAGYRLEARRATSPHDEEVMGLHLVLDERTAFWNCMDRAMRWKWLDEREETRNWMSWILPYFQLFLERYVTERDPLFLYAWAGLVSGLSQQTPEDGSEKDARRPPESFELLRRILSMDERDWRKVGLPQHEREGLDTLARRLARAVEDRSWRPRWRSSPPVDRRTRLGRRILRLAGRLGRKPE